jgi:hypothetical protein
MDKIAALNEILQLDPANAFARYGLAMEHLSQMSAQTLAKQGRAEEAIARLNEGIAVANRTNNTHAASEMQTLLDDLTV